MVMVWCQTWPRPSRTTILLFILARTPPSYIIYMCGTIFETSHEPFDGVWVWVSIRWRMWSVEYRASCHVRCMYECMWMEYMFIQTNIAHCRRNQGGTSTCDVHQHPYIITMMDAWNEIRCVTDMDNDFPQDVRVDLHCILLGPRWQKKKVDDHCTQQVNKPKNFQNQTYCCDLIL